MSCSIAAAHRRSRSNGSPSWIPPSASASHSSSASRATWSVWVKSAPYAHARLCTDARRTSSNSGGAPPSSRGSPKTPPPRPAPPASPSARPPVGRGVRGDLRRRGQVAHRAADPREPPAAGEPLGRRQLLRDVPAQRAQLLALGLLARQEALRHPHRAQRPRSEVGRQPPLHARELHRAAAEVERDAVGQRGRVDGGQVAVARLLLAREHPGLESRPRARRLEELLPVGRLPDRRRRHRADLLDAGRAAEVGVQLQRLQRALHRRGLEGPRGIQALADAHGLVDLVRAAPPRVLDPGEHHEAERVRPQVDDGELSLPAPSPRLSIASPATAAFAQSSAVAWGMKSTWAESSWTSAANRYGGTTQLRSIGSIRSPSRSRTRGDRLSAWARLTDRNDRTGHR